MMVDIDSIIKRYEEFRSSYEGPGSELIDRDRILQRKRARLQRHLKEVDLEIIRNGHEMAAALWPLLIKEEQDEAQSKLESISGNE